MSSALLKRLLEFGHVKFICRCARSVRIVANTVDHDDELEFGLKLLTVQRDPKRADQTIAERKQIRTK